MPEQGEGPETGCYVYGVVPAGGAPSSLLGIDDQPVELVEYGDIAAAITPFVLDRPAGRRAELMAHTAVVDALASEGTVLPIRFGSVLADRDSVVDDLLAPDHDRFVTLLADLAGKRQLNLRARYVPEQVLAEIVQAHPEIAELRRRTRDLPEGAVHPDLVRLGELVSRAMEGAREGDAQLVLDHVMPYALAESLRPGGGVEHLLDVALLVEEERIPELEESLETLAEAVHERIRLRLMGPVAPYDFAEAPAWA